MNDPQDKGPNPGQFPSVDKTFVEGSGATGQTGIRPGTRVNATSLGAANPYTSVPGSGAAYGPDALPSGNDPIPLGSGTVVGLLGAGGMARVYRIWNEKLEVFRAVKILLPNRQADLKNRFETEAKITAKLHHPNIVEIYNVGDWNGLPYLEMEFIDGDSLESFINKRGKLPDSVCAAIALFVARALAYAHSQEFLIYGKNYHGVIHRDLKPANIMISSAGEVRLMDFGIARPTEASLHTVEGNIVGTMQYLSPEQMDGVDIDCRTDLYSFGAILYEMLTGTKTFPQDTITNLMKKKIMNDYRRFSDFDFQVSPALAKIAQKCLQIDKKDRYDNAEAVLRELENAYRQCAVEAPAKLLRRYLTDPDGFESASSPKLPSWIGPKVLVPVAGGLVLCGLLAVFIVTGPGKPEEATNAGQTTMVTTAPPRPAPPPSPTVDTLQPLGGTPTTTPRRPPTDGSPQGAGRTTTPTTPPVVPPRPPRPAPPRPVESPLDRLKGKYNSTDMLTVGKSAVRAGAYADGITALESVPENHPESKLRALLLLEAYAETGRTKDALFIVNSQSMQDAQFDLLSGRLYQNLGKNKVALDYFQSALTKPSIARSRNEIRNDALFYTAVVWSEHYRNNPSSDTRFQALNAWNIVKRSYSSTPDHPRFKKANVELASIQ